MWWLGAEQVTSLYLTEKWRSSLTQYGHNRWHKNEPFLSYGLVCATRKSKQNKTKITKHLYNHSNIRAMERKNCNLHWNENTILTQFSWLGAALEAILTVSSVANHYTDVIMGAIASQIASLTSVYSIVYSDADQRKHQSSASLAFVRGIHRGPVNSPHKWPVTRKMFPFDDVTMSDVNFVKMTTVPCQCACSIRTQAFIKFDTNQTFQKMIIL